MDLVAGIRKEGSRGGRDSFKWSDVKESSHRENYLGHSLMAPVGRWQQGRDLGWYAKNNGDDSEEAAARAKQEREEELRRVKEAEQDAMARALGLPVAPRSSNPNMTPLGGSEVQKAIQESTDADDKAEGGRGIGFGSYGGGLNMDGTEGEILAPVGMDFGIRPRGDGRDERSRGDRSHRSRRDRSRETGRRRDTEQRDRGASHKKDKDSEREHRRHHHRERRENRRHQSRSRSRSRSPRREPRHRGDSRERRHGSDRRRDVDRSGRHRSRSPRRDRTDPEIGRDRDPARDHRHRRT